MKGFEEKPSKCIVLHEIIINILRNCTRWKCVQHLQKHKITQFYQVSSSSQCNKVVQLRIKCKMIQNQCKY
jgi:hypothetical protein